MPENLHFGWHTIKRKRSAVRKWIARGYRCPNLSSVTCARQIKPVALQAPGTRISSVTEIASWFAYCCSMKILWEKHTQIQSPVLMLFWMFERKLICIFAGAFVSRLLNLKKGANSVRWSKKVIHLLPVVSHVTIISVFGPVHLLVSFCCCSISHWTILMLTFDVFRNNRKTTTRIWRTLEWF